MPRDQDLLRALARLRVARTSAVVQLCLGGIRRDTAARRLRRLFDAGFLAVRTAAATQESLYMLGPKGRQFVTGEGEAEPGVPLGSLEHHLAIVDTWVSVATLELPGVGLQLARADWELRTEFGGGLAIIPDLFVVLDTPPGPVALAIEVDLGTEPLKVLRAKVENYAGLALGKACSGGQGSVSASPYGARAGFPSCANCWLKAGADEPFYGALRMALWRNSRGLQQA